LTACQSWAKYVTWAHARAFAGEVGRSCEKESPLSSLIFIALAVHLGQLVEFNGMASWRPGHRFVTLPFEAVGLGYLTAMASPVVPVLAEVRSERKNGGTYG